jgi:group I intron endonuclease
MVFYIYTLSNPTTNEVRYVGKTINIARRYKQHLYDKRTTHKASWVQSLKKVGLKPKLIILEECNKDNWQEREKYWIRQFNNLTNHLEGGGCHYTRTTTYETKAKISKIHKGKILSNEQKNKLRIKSVKRPCYIDNVLYESVKSASQILGIPFTTIHDRLNNKKNSNYIWKL